ncbi:Microcystin-dependent protein [Pedobacter steynii]|uniref:Microcystin-dependent protein n=1 Tax=Pedobacter steynii TaxID=430522 RepID=A0A1G9WDC8_9SPHI|nr:tail fiber protein [Pedobacter steynii]NQX40262.1 phage tail protein [Pedobacter steynii]SDM82518.1 Microcystin-dependent protein [Pedobacter steynii]
MEEYLGIVKIFAGNFAPRGWMLCQGQILAIAPNTALFSILGTTYGGNGQTTFALPNLCGRAPVGWGQGPGLSNYVLGETTGTESTSILITNMPAHNHVATSTLSLNASDAAATVATPVAGNALGAGKDVNTDPVSMYTTSAPTVPLAGGTVATTVGIAGGSQPISILQPILAVTYIICTSGLFPSRN